MDHVDAVVIGAGVVGLAVARALALAGREVVVLEAAPGVGTGISSRNSEVIHAGLYYAPGSLKARLCVQGRQMLYDYCAERGIAHRRCGKLIVATTEAERAPLAAIAERAAAAGVHDLVPLTPGQARALEPALHCVAALHSPSTGIVDSHALMLALLGDVERAGGVLAVQSAVRSAVRHARARTGSGPGAAGMALVMEDGTELATHWVVNAAGLQAPALARRFEGLAPQHVPEAHFAKGSYFTLAGRAPFSRLIYPVPQPGGLGVHLTLDLAGQARFGPDVQWVAAPDDLAVDPARAPAFESEVRRYWPGLPAGALQPGYAGMRPKISGPGEAAADFLIQGPRTHGVPGLVNLFGMESPGLTSCLAIGAHVAAMLHG
ncbi:NAD(P)/FAD-dependent oxidoreductase [Comamonadaceae bacterium OH2545_COT-014]|nr:NAD(P)/FAD-dependent oxidoreductase [Comamonadaceae bacterium OH2545_COT-014]